jgi:hypothetical protein
LKLTVALIYILNVDHLVHEHLEFQRLYSYLSRRLCAPIKAIMDHNYTKDMMIGLAVGFMILPVVFVCLRVWAKVLAKRLAWDDYLTIAALVSGYNQRSGLRSHVLKCRRLFR